MIVARPAPGRGSIEGRSPAIRLPRNSGARISPIKDAKAQGARALPVARDIGRRRLVYDRVLSLGSMTKRPKPYRQGSRKSRQRLHVVAIAARSKAILRARDEGLAECPRHKSQENPAGEGVIDVQPHTSVNNFAAKILTELFRKPAANSPLAAKCAYLKTFVERRTRPAF